MAKAMEQERREVKSRTSALPGQRRLRRRVQGEDYLLKEDDFAMASSPPRGPKKPFRPVKPRGYRAGDHQTAHQGPMSPYNIMYPCKCPFHWMEDDARMQCGPEDSEIADAAADVLVEFGINTNSDGVNQN
ncbi:hypothetical protein [Oryza sativa Japonica Group]|uniref:Uncharacterized protein P0581F09.9 n=1 Tax=Oryza sativa subsp. japonica TaxID=39947 RepID=Q5N7F1_ORYSJ|nr:hypothetical protein [Oryza sativa Japonica Group]